MSKSLLFFQHGREKLTAGRMLAVMTMNVGYFMAVLGGVFLGEMVWGRWTKGAGH